MTVRATLTWCAAVALAGTVAACGATPPAQPGATPYRIASVEFEGVESVDRHALADALVSQRNTINPFTPTSFYNRFEVAADIERIETFYADHGYFDARVVHYDVELVDRNRHDRAHLVFTVDEGLQTSLAEDATFDIGSLRSIEDPAELFRHTPLRRGTAFNRATIDAERARIRRELQERSYARARVEARVYVDRVAHAARVFFFFDPGVSCVFGEVLVEGERSVPAGLIRRNTDIVPGDLYRQSLLRSARVELYDLDAFTSVEVEALLRGTGEEIDDEAFSPVDEAMAEAGFTVAMHLEDPVAPGAVVAGLADNIGQIRADDPTVPVRITVVESPAANYKFGGGIAIESSRSEAYGRSAAIWRNVLAPLNRAELEGRLGYAWLPTVFGRDTLASGIIGEVGAGLSRPRAILRIFDASLRLGFEHGVETDHEFSRPTARVAFENRLDEFTRFALAYQFEYNIIRDFADEPVEDAGPRTSCDRLPQAFRMGYFDASIWSVRRDPLFERTSRDWAGSLGVQVGEGLLGDYPYARFDPEIRYYQRISRRISLATRAGAGAIVDFGEPVPRNQCLFLGGGNTVRGFADRRLGPHREPNIPHGGVASYLLNIEPRFMLTRAFGLVAFLDIGQVNDELAFDLAWGGGTGLGAAAGGGIRVYTPIGPIRADIGVRLSRVPADFGRVQPFGFVVSLGEAF